MRRVFDRHSRMFLWEHSSSLYTWQQTSTTIASFNLDLVSLPVLTDVSSLRNWCFKVNSPRRRVAFRVTNQHRSQLVEKERKWTGSSRGFTASAAASVLLCRASPGGSLLSIHIPLLTFLTPTRPARGLPTSWSISRPHSSQSSDFISKTTNGCGYTSSMPPPHWKPTWTWVSSTWPTGAECEAGRLGPAH